MTLLLGLLQRCLSARKPAAVHVPMALASLAASSQPGTTAPAHRRARPLRVVRSVERGGRGARWDGRVLISGGIDEVCAELERLAALEARTH